MAMNNGYLFCYVLVTDEHRLYSLFFASLFSFFKKICI